MSELTPRASTEVNEHEISAEELVEANQDLGMEVVGLTVQVGEAEASDDDGEKVSSSDTVKMIDDYKAEHGSVQGLSMKDLAEKGFDPDMTLLKIGNERLEEKLEIVNVNYRAKRDTEQWQRMEEVEARNIPISDDEVDALLDAGANPQHVIDALQRTKPQDGIDNPSSARIAARLDKLVDAGLPPAIVAARLNPSWREAVKDNLAAAESRWQEVNRLKAIA